MAGAELLTVEEVARAEVTLVVLDALEVGRLTAPFCRLGVEVGAFELEDVADKVAVFDVLAAHLPDRFLTFLFCFRSFLSSVSEPRLCFLRSRLAALADPTKRWELWYVLRGWRTSMSLAERSRVS